MRKDIEVDIDSRYHNNTNVIREILRLNNLGTKEGSKNIHNQLKWFRRKVLFKIYFKEAEMNANNRIKTN